MILKGKDEAGIDKEWLALLDQAKKIGLSVNEIREYLLASRDVPGGLTRTS